jgi:hypothetical protein
MHRSSAIRLSTDWSTNVSVKRSILGMVGVFAGLLTAALLAVPAHASAAASQPAGSGVATTPAAPGGVRSAAIAAVPPTISPPASFIHVPPLTQYNCPSGNLCTSVWDPTSNDFRVFFLFVCHKYALANWLGTNGTYFDAQTGNVLSTFYRQDGVTAIKSFRPDFTNHNQDWTPVWFIRNC